VITTAAEAIAAAQSYAAAVAPGAVSRDKDRQLPVAELADLAQTGLLASPFRPPTADRAWESGPSSRSS
jgi:hypothetical protein